MTLVLALILASGFGVAHLRMSSTDTDLAASLQAVDERIGRAEANNDASELRTIRGQLQTLSTRHGESTEIDARGIRLTSLEDRLLGRTRLAGAVALGTLPSTAIPADRPIRLLHGNAGLYVIGTSLYELDRDDNHLIELLSPGTLVDGHTVGPILDAVATRSGVATTDGTVLFSRGASGQWTAQEMVAELPLGESGLAAITIFERQLVAIDHATGSLVLRPIGSGSLGGTPALPPGVLAAFTGARDLGVDGELFVLGDSTGLTAYEADGETIAFDVPVSPPLNEPRAMDVAGSGLWLLDTGAGAGRLIHFLPDDGTATTYLLPVDSVDMTGTLSAATDFAIDMDAGRIVFVVEGALWSIPVPSEG